VTTLSIRNIKVEDVMTKLEDSYMLPLDTVLDFETISEIKEQGPHTE
jgi:metal transporter CNNM